MKKTILLSVFTILSLVAMSQTVIPNTTTVETINKMPAGTFVRFYTDALDTADLTINKVPVCPTCPPPVICPVCPPPPTPRIVTSISIAGNVVSCIYNSGSPSTFTLSQPIKIQ